MLEHAAVSLAKQADQVLQERLGIGISQFKIMRVLHQSPNIQQRHIAERLGQTEASISRQTKLMHEQSLLQTTISPHNRREHITTLTLKGQRLADEAAAILDQYNAPMFNALSDKQQKQLLAMLAAMHEEICKGEKPGRCYQVLP